MSMFITLTEDEAKDIGRTYLDRRNALDLEINRHRSTLPEYLQDKEYLTMLSGQRGMAHGILFKLERAKPVPSEEIQEAAL